MEDQSKVGSSVFQTLLLFFLIFPMATGVVKTKTEKGFGFIAVQGSDDVFFHHTVCNGQFESLQEGQTVQLEFEKGDKGLKATSVTASTGGEAAAA